MRIMDLSVQDATGDDLAWANARYVEVDFVPSSPADRLVVARLDGTRVGVGRVVPTGPDSGELGGIYVSPTARGRGVADAIVRRLMATSEQRTLFCIPFTDLSGIYERCGFAPVPDDDLPDPVKTKLAWCRAHYDVPVRLLRWDRP